MGLTRYKDGRNGIVGVSRDSLHNQRRKQQYGSEYVSCGDGSSEKWTRGGETQVRLAWFYIHAPVTF